MTLPSGFIKMAANLLGEEADEFLKAMQEPPVCSIRCNSRKPGSDFDDQQPVKWCPTGFYLSQRPVFTLDPMLHAGAYYVQDASSMIYREVTSRILSALGNGSASLPVCVLDLCAAPGGKTTAIIDALPDSSKVIANEFVSKRAAILKENLIKWGFPNTEVMNKDTSFFRQTGFQCDIVAVDAPCSGEGMMRKDNDAVKQWSPQLIDDCAKLQREILTNAAAVIRPGGFLIYSTCTFNHIENEDNARFIRDELRLEPFDLNFPQEWGIPRGIDTDIPAYRFMPHKTKGEGLFLAVFKRPGEWIAPYLDISRNVQSITKISRISKQKPLPLRDKGNQDVPDIEEIMSVNFDRQRFPEASLTRQQALAYLRREAIVLPPDTPKGIVIVTYNNLPLGAVKNIGSRANNLYPKNWRIRM